jgi:predicted peroxiredoxin
MTAKTLVHIQHGTDDVEKATVAMTIANMSSSSGAETFMFVSSDAVELIMKDFDDHRRIAGYPALNSLLSRYVESGGKFWVYEDSAKVRGIVPEDLIDGVELVDASRTVSFLGEGGRVLM